MLSILLLPLSFQSVSGLVTFSAPAAPAARLLSTLGQRMNLNLTADRQAGSSVLLVEVREMAPDRLLKTIAEVADAEWEREGTKLRLVRTPAKINRLWQDDAARRRAFIAQSLSRDQARLERDGAMTLDITHRLFDLQANPQKVSASIGMHARGALSAALLLGPDVLAAVRAGQRVVYAANPNRAQRPLTNALRNSAVQAQRDYVEYSTLLRNHQPPNYPGVIFSDIEEGDRDMARAHVVVSRPAGSDDLAIRSRRFNAGGKNIGESLYTLRFPRPRATPPGEPLPISPVLRELAGRTEQSPAGRELPSPALVAALSDPERNEPLELIFGSYLRKFADGRGLVACLPDSAFEAGRRALRLPNLDFPTLLSEADLGAESEDGLVTVRPLHPALTLGEATPRAALRDLIATLPPPVFLRVEAAGAYEQKRPGGPRPGGLDWSVLEALLGSAIGSVGDGRIEFANFDWAAFAASITPLQWKVMAERPLEGKEVLESQREVLHRALGMNVGETSLERDTRLRVLFEAMEPTLYQDGLVNLSVQAKTGTEPFLGLQNPHRLVCHPVAVGALSRKPIPDARYFTGFKRTLDFSFQIGTAEQRISMRPTAPLYDVTLSDRRAVPLEKLSPQVRGHFHPKPGTG